MKNWRCGRPWMLRLRRRTKSFGRRTNNLFERIGRRMTSLRRRTTLFET
ncbi:hypothetical protein LINPERPRIM_LOCUS31034 [Linum perenne]